MLIRQLACAALVFGSLVFASPSQSDRQSYRRSLPESGLVRRGYSEYGSHVYKRSHPGGIIIPDTPKEKPQGGVVASTRRYKRSPTFKIGPGSDRVIVHKGQGGNSRSGIVIPDTAREKPQEGEVLAVGPGRRLSNSHITPMDVNVGDRVQFSKYRSKTW